MKSDILFDSSKFEPDERKREKLTFYNPYNATILEGGGYPIRKDESIDTVAILSSN